ncbi:MAG: hypothetical protein CBC65_000515 [Rhodothermaceae bacterium TMED105]|nr:MAG: hypothetical protein CBC65_000515 [Rhodothermaceae bacterium TMED105]
MEKSPYYKNNNNRMFAHRGIHRQCQDENTLSSFQKSLTTMDGFECDIRLSSDGVPIVFTICLHIKSKKVLRNQYSSQFHRYRVSHITKWSPLG